MSYKLTGGWLVQRQLQYIEETTFGTTPVSPTLIHAGPIVSIDDSQENQAIKYRQIGSRDLYAMIKTGNAYSFDVTFNPVDSALMEYAINTPESGNPKNISKSLSFVKSALINGTEMFTIYKGCVADSVDISITADSAVEVTISYICKTITTPSTSHGLTTPVWATNPVTIPWTNLSGGTDPFSFNAAAVDTPSFSCSVTHNIEQVKVNGMQDVKFVEPTLRDVTFEFDTFHKGTSQLTELTGTDMTGRAMSYKLSVADNKRLLFDNAFLETVAMSDSTSDTTPKIESWTGTAKGVQVTNIS